MAKEKKTKRQFFTYSQQSMQQAIEAVRTGIMSKKKAAAEFKVPRSTLVRKLSGQVPLRRKMGPSSELSENEEKILVEWMIAMARKGFPIHKTNLIQSVKKYLVENEKVVRFFNDSKTPGRAWFEGFLKRHPEIKERHVESLSKARAAVTADRIENWFVEIETFLKSEGLEDVLADPSRIFNADEAGFSLCPKSGKVLGPAKMKEDFYIRVSGEKEQITVMGTFSADGKCVPPMLIFPYKKMPKAIVDSIPSSWGLGRSDSGWMNSEVFFEFISNHFLTYLKLNEIKRPVLLFVDGHRSHLTLHVSKFCDENEIILTSLYPNTTHIMQPADVSVFKPLKAGWKSAVRDWKFENFPKDVTRHTFGSILNDVIKKYAKKETIENGFRKSGLFPFDKKNVDYSKCIPNRCIGVQETDKSKGNGQFLANVLEVVEQKIANEKLIEFQNAYQNNISNWEGNVESVDLYEMWRSLKDNCHKPQEHVTAENTVSSPKTVHPCYFSEPSTSATSLATEMEMQQKTPPRDLDSSSGANCHNTSSMCSPVPKKSYNYGMKESEGYKVPTPFKTCLSYPKTPEKTPITKKKRTIFPFVVSCAKYRDFYENEKNKKVILKKKKPMMPKVVDSSPVIPKGHIDKNNKVPLKKKEPVMQQVVDSSSDSETLSRDPNGSINEKKLTSKRQNKQKISHPPSDDSSSNSDVEFKYADDQDDMDPSSDLEDSIQLEEGNYVIVEYESRFYPGVVLKRDHEGAEVRAMETAGIGAWKWPLKEDVLFYFNKNIKCIINQPTVKNVNRGHFYVPEMAAFD